MKKIALVLIEIDMDHSPGPSRMRPHHGGMIQGGPFGKSGPADVTMYEVQIIPNDVEGKPLKTIESQRTSLAYNLGHVVADMLQTEAAKNDPRTNVAVRMDNPGKCIIASEKEAWEIAKEIAPIDESEAKGNLESYETNADTLDSTYKQAAMLKAAIEADEKTKRTVN